MTPPSDEALQIVGIGNLINAGNGISADDVNATEVCLVALVIDDSGSMSRVNGDRTKNPKGLSNWELAIEGHNSIIKDLKRMAQRDGILFHSSLLNRGVVSQWVQIDNATELDARSHSMGGHTPLRSTAVSVLGFNVREKYKEFDDAAANVRTITAFVTDGGNTDSVSTDAIKRIVEPMILEETHIIIGIGIHDGYTDFHQEFKNWGLQDQWIKTVDDDPKEIMKVFQMVSRVSQKVSQSSAANVASQFAGGFGG